MGGSCEHGPEKDSACLRETLFSRCTRDPKRCRELGERENGSCDKQRAESNLGSSDRELVFNSECDRKIMAGLD